MDKDPCVIIVQGPGLDETVENLRNRPAENLRDTLQALNKESHNPKAIYISPNTEQPTEVKHSCLAQAAHAIEQALRRGQAPILFLDGHGTVSSITGRHGMQMDDGEKAKATVTLLTSYVEAYEAAYRQQYPEEPIPPLPVTINSCYSKMLLKDISPALLAHVALQVNDAAYNVSYLDNLRTLLSPTYGRSPEKYFFNKMVEAILSQSANALSCSAFVHQGEAVVLDAAVLCDKVTAATLPSFRQKALQGFALVPAASQPGSGESILKEAIQSYSPEDLGNPQRDTIRALIGYLGDSMHRFTSLAHYTSNALPIQQFMDPKQSNKSARELFHLLHKINDKRILEALPSFLRGDSDYLTPRYQALDKCGIPIIHGAIEVNQTAIATIAVKARGINSQDRDGHTPLTKAIHEENTEALATLLHAGADTERPNKHGVTPLMAARERGHTAMIEALLAAPRTDRTQKRSQPAQPDGPAR